jgi:hypothetical protein
MAASPSDRDKFRRLYVVRQPTDKIASTSNRLTTNFQIPRLRV